MTAQTRPDEMIRILRAEFVTKSGGVPGGGAGSCVTFTCGAIGWRGEAGTTPRVLIHEAAFQLSSAGNARGDYAIDFQQLQWDDTYVAAAEMSAIYSNEENIIDANCDWSTIVGEYNNILANSAGCHIVGAFNTINTDCYAIVSVGWSSILEDTTYGFYAIDDNVSDAAFGCFAIGEANSLIETVNDHPTYTGTFGRANIEEGDIWYVFQFGDENKVYGLGTPGEQCWMGMQVGTRNYSENVNLNYLFGEQLKSRLATGADYFSGRMIIGESGFSGPNDGTGYAGGFHQVSWFSQDDYITTWPVAWTTSRFEFPILQESIWGFVAYISVTNQFCTNIGSWKIEGLIKNAGGATSLVWSTITVLYRDTATKDWQALADNVNDRLVFRFRDTAGPDITTYNVHIDVKTEEVGYD